mmetsp:Transcript_38932/g.83075  ORF Transcript_38932/g.83075 Transcript_38932/m.83075 type:complete len:278 (+) Transcript_38932:465-1298(+)
MVQQVLRKRGHDDRIGPGQQHLPTGHAVAKVHRHDAQEVDVALRQEGREVLPKSVLGQQGIHVEQDGRQPDRRRDRPPSVAPFGDGEFLVIDPQAIRRRQGRPEPRIVLGAAQRFEQRLPVGRIRKSFRKDSPHRRGVQKRRCDRSGRRPIRSPQQLLHRVLVALRALPRRGEHVHRVQQDHAQERQAQAAIDRRHFIRRVVDRCEEPFRHEGARARHRGPAVLERDDASPGVGRHASVRPLVLVMVHDLDHRVREVGQRGPYPIVVHQRQLQLHLG